MAENVVKAGLHDWRAGKVPTLEALEPHLHGLADGWTKSPEAAREIAACCAAWFEPIQQELNDRTNEICQKYRIPVGALALDVPFDAANWDISELDLDSPNPTAGIMGFGAAIAALLIASLLGGGGTALLMSGPIGWVIGLIIGLAATYYGKDKAEQWIKELDIPTSVRKLLLRSGKIEEQCTEMEPKLSLDVQTQLDNMPESFEQLALKLKEQLAHLLDAKADEARLLIR